MLYIVQCKKFILYCCDTWIICEFFPVLIEKGAEHRTVQPDKCERGKESHSKNKIK